MKKAFLLLLLLPLSLYGLRFLALEAEDLVETEVILVATLTELKWSEAHTAKLNPHSDVPKYFNERILKGSGTLIIDDVLKGKENLENTEKLLFSWADSVAGFESTMVRYHNHVGRKGIWFFRIEDEKLILKHPHQAQSYQNQKDLDEAVLNLKGLLSDKAEPAATGQRR